MSGDKYSSDYQREELEKFEGFYTSEEIELNKRLYDECSKSHIDFEKVEELLKQGADPLGGTELYGWSLLDHVYGELVSDSQDSDSIDLPQITECFLRYGMNIDRPKIPYDGNNSINPLWMFTFVTNENSIIALKLLLDYGLSEESFGEFWGHSMTDFFHIECGDPQNDEFWNNACTWTFKMLLLGASYDHILQTDESLREFICCDLNSYDVHKFRDWDKFEYIFDTTHCDQIPELYKSIIRIYEKDTGTEVWKIGVGKAGRDVLAELTNHYENKD